MSKIIALIIGVSNYLHKGVSDLPFCKNDIATIKEAFVHGLGVLSKDIFTCGDSGNVLSVDFVRTIQRITTDIMDDDVLLFYFSGHGTNIKGDHYLVLTDSYISTQELITCLEAIPAKSKVLFLDCCHAGNFEVNGSAGFDVDSAVESFVGKGYAVFASSNAMQVSYQHPEKQISLFTSFLNDALTNKYIIREGKKSLYDIHKLLFLMIEIWNKSHPTLVQTPVYKANIGGTIFFNVEDYHPYFTDNYVYNTESYTIFSVEPTHSGIAKRYSVKVILKKPMLLSEITVVNHEIVSRVKYLNIYSGPMQERRWKNKPANLVFCYFGLSETDIVNSNFICYTTWADEAQDKKWWYKTGKDYETINDINIHINPHYDFLKQFMMDHTALKEELVIKTKEIIHRLISLAEQIISLYNYFLNGEISELKLIDEISKLAPEIDALYFRETNLDIPPNEIAEWSRHCSAIAGCIHDFTLYYSNETYLNRTLENRKACMDMSIKRYYKDLEIMKELEKDL